MAELAEGTVTANGLRFATLSAGPRDGPLALCLHGFPDTAHTWRHLLPALAGAGFRAVAPFLRGYAPSEVPADGRYQLGALVADAVALHEELGGAGADGGDVLVGHDWGAMATYGAGAFAPERFRRLVTIAVPPPAAMATSFFDYAQLRRSFYVFLFQTPLAEIAVSADGMAFIDGLWRDWSPGYDASFDVPLVKESLKDPASLSAAIGYYRAMLDGSLHVPELAAEQAATAQVAPQPTLYLHGETDGTLGADRIGDVSALLSPGSEAAILPGVGHFLHLETPGPVNERIVAWLTTP